MPVLQHKSSLLIPCGVNVCMADCCCSSSTFSRIYGHKHCSISPLCWLLVLVFVFCFVGVATYMVPIFLFAIVWRTLEDIEAYRNATILGLVVFLTVVLYSTYLS